MWDRVNVNFEDIVRNERVVIEFLNKNSDTFSFTTIIKKPYSQLPPVFGCNVQLQPFVIRYIYERKDWPIDFLGQLKHQIMVVCRCCKDSGRELLQMSNVFLPIVNDRPEDICFYRNGKLWFATISHEKMAFMVDATNEDIAFLKENCIRVYD